MSLLNIKRCLVCRSNHDVLHWHFDEEGSIWCWCCKCNRGYSIQQYCTLAGISLRDLLAAGNWEFNEAQDNTVNKMDWPVEFVPMSDIRAKSGRDYVLSRGLDVSDGMFYDTYRKGIVFPYYFDKVFCGAQIRMVKPWVDRDGNTHKIDTMPGTRLGLLFYGWNQGPFLTNIKALIVTEGAFNALAIQQSLNQLYGGYIHNPWKCVAISGSGVTKHQREVLQELQSQGLKIVAAPDGDEAGIKMLHKMIEGKLSTHYALPWSADKDWNDYLKELGKEEFGRSFIRRIQHV